MVSNLVSNVSVANKYKHTSTSYDFPIHRGNPQLGNPFPLADYANDRDVVLNIYTQYFLESLPRLNNSFRGIVQSNKPVNLVCFCHPLKCHGDVCKLYIDFARDLPPSVNPVEAFRVHMGYRPPILRDGVDHINIYSNGKTELGRLLSNFAFSPMILKEGEFASLEGYWYWKCTGSKHDVLKKLFGAEAKKIGRTFERVHCEGFDDFIDIAVRAKIYQNPLLKRLLSESHLPFTHYYGWGNDTNALIIRSSYRFLETIHKIRTELSGGEPTIIAGSRSIKDPELIHRAILDSGFKISKVISGKAKGVDILGWHWAKVHNVPCDEYPVTKEEWEISKAAGHIRNAKMETVGKQGIILIENNSTGSEGMLKLMRTNKKPVHIVRL